MISTEKLLEIKPLKNDKDYLISSCGRIFSKKKNKLMELKPRLNINGYYCFSIRDKNKKNIVIMVHVAVLRCFSRDKKSGECGAHLDGKKGNNNISNLRWVTFRENVLHKIIHGTMPRGETHSRSKLNDHAVREIRKLGGTDKELNKAAIRFNVHVSTVYLVYKNKTWRHIT